MKIISRQATCFPNLITEQDAYCFEPIESSMFDVLTSRIGVLESIDPDGFCLTLLERRYYRESHKESEIPWMISKGTSNFFISHSHLMARYGFGRFAAEQLLSSEKEVRQLTFIRPKIGLDCSIVYQNDTQYMELFHYEYDTFFTRIGLNQLNHHRNLIESIVEHTNWQQQLRNIYKEGIDKIVNADDAADAKVRLLGLHRAYNTIKVIQS